MTTTVAGTFRSLASRAGVPTLTPTFTRFPIAFPSTSAFNDGGSTCSNKIEMEIESYNKIKRGETATNKQQQQQQQQQQ
jgi:hypothetical protein